MNAYLERMGQLDKERVKGNRVSLERTALPLNRPNPQEPSGIPVGNSPKPEDDEAYKNSHFYMNFNHFKENDPHFGGVADKLTELATGLRKQVQQGYMPAQIAEQRIHQFVMDTQKEFVRKEPELQRQQKEQEKQQQMMGMLSALTQGQEQQSQQPQEVPPEGISAAQATQMPGGE